MNLYKIINDDCFNIFPTIKTNSIDLILTDPPYNISSTSKIGFKNGKAYSTKELYHDAFKDEYSEIEYTKIMLELAKQTFRILKPDGSFITFIDRGKPYYLKPFYRLLIFRNSIYFIKKNPAPHLRKNNYRSGVEVAFWFSKPKYHITFVSQKKMINVFYGIVGHKLHRKSQGKVTKHPTEKYEWMIKPLIERHSRINDLILDPFLGSGTTLKVAQDLNRSCIGIEIKKEYCEMSKNRCFQRTFLDREIKYEYIKNGKGEKE